MYFAAESCSHANPCHDSARKVPVMHHVLQIKESQTKQYLGIQLSSIFLNQLTKQITKYGPRKYEGVLISP